jgi:hypothetical protein
MSRREWVWVAAILILAGGGGCWFVFKNLVPEMVEAEVQKVVAERVENEVAGRVEKEVQEVHRIRKEMHKTEHEIDVRVVDCAMSVLTKRDVIRSIKLLKDRIVQATERYLQLRQDARQNLDAKTQGLLEADFVDHLDAIARATRLAALLEAILKKEDAKAVG